MAAYYLNIWVTAADKTGSVVEVGPVPVAVYATKYSCATLLKKMVGVSGAAVRGEISSPLPMQPAPKPLPYLSVIPGGTGYGMHTIAGRGGKVYKVTNLNPRGEDSIGAAVEASEPRVVVFEVSGNIDLQKYNLVVRNPFITIAGQTAPPPGISIVNGGITCLTHDVLIQHIRSRGGLAAERVLPLNVDNHLGNAYNIVVDHCSLAWSTDDLMASWWGAHDITWSHCLATGELSNTAVWADCAGKIALNDSRDSRILMLSNAMLTGYARMPLANADPFVFVNNLVYNWGGTGSQLMREGATSGGEFVLVGNHYRKGPLNAKAWSPKPILLRDNWVPGAHIHLAGNYAPDWSPSEQKDLVDNRTGYSLDDLLVATPGAWPEGLIALPGNSIFNPVLDYAGAFPRHRDSLDSRLVSDCRAGIGDMVNSTTFPALAQNKRTFTIPANANADSGDGYTNMEKLLHIMAAQVEGRV